MKRGWKILWLTLMLAVVGLAVWHWRRSREYVYEGRRVSEWVREVNSSNANLVSVAQPTVAMMGTNALPTIVQWVGAKDSQAWEKVIDWQNRQSWMQTKLVKAKDLREDAVTACQLIALLGSSLGPGGEPWFLRLAELLPDREVGRDAWRCLRALNLAMDQRERIMPLLIRALKNPALADEAGKYLGEMKEKAAPAVPALVEWMKEDRKHRQTAIFSLGQIRSQPLVAVPALIQILRDSESPLQLEAMEVLQKFGPQARAAIPELRSFYSNTNEVLGIMITNIVVSPGGRSHGDMVDTRTKLGDAARAAVKAIEGEGK